MNKSLSSSAIVAFLIFLSWGLISYIASEIPRLPENKLLIIPFLWSCIFIYLHGKNHLYIAINSYVIFLLILFADILNFSDVSGRVQISYLLLSFFMIFVFVFIYQILFENKPRLASVFSFIITVVSYAIPLFYIIYSINFDTVITRDVFYAISQTSINESMEFISTYISPLWIGATFSLSVFIGFLLLKQEKCETNRIETSLLIFIMIFLAALTFVNKDNIRLYSFAIGAVKEYQDDLALFYKTQEKINTGEIQYKAEKAEIGETYIVVIGESLNKQHMGIYGYMRETTPLLTKIAGKEDLLVFDNAFSNHTHTVPALYMSLTEANQLNKKEFYGSLSIINILNRANIETYWITNQNLYGEWDNIVSVIAHQASHLIALNKATGIQTTTQQHDDSVISEINKILSDDSENSRVILIHLMGNHGDYCARYPEEYEIFSRNLIPSEFGYLSTMVSIRSFLSGTLFRNGISKDINCYDNSVLYNDAVVSSLIKLLEKKNGIAGFLYFSDHADDVIGQLGHDSSNFSYSMTQIPLLMWFSEQYKSRYQDKYKIMMGHQNELFSNDDIYDTLIGIFNIDTERYEAINDLSSPLYSLDESKAFTLHGKIAYADQLNHSYHQKKNIAKLKSDNQTLRVIPHRVNTIGKLKEIWFDGYRAFEIDVIFGEDGTARFEIGHNHGVMSGISFEQFIATVSPSEIKKIWVDFKNLTQDNHKKALERLNHLDEQFTLKEKLIIESGATGSYFREFQEAGWHTSYYLPTDKIINLLEENKRNEMKSLAKIISKQSILQNLSAISFDHRLYPFVKNYLEPLMSNKIMYHTWDMALNIYDIDFYTKLMQKNYFIDDRVKTILLPYESLFNL